MRTRPTLSLHLLLLHVLRVSVWAFSLKVRHAGLGLVRSRFECLFSMTLLHGSPAAFVHAAVAAAAAAAADPVATIAAASASEAAMRGAGAVASIIGGIGALGQGLADIARQVM